MRHYYIDDCKEVYVFPSAKAPRAQRYSRPNGRDWVKGCLGLCYTRKEVAEDRGKRVSRADLPKSLLKAFPKI